MGKVVNLALIGCGYWGKNYISTANTLEGVNLTYICDSDERSLAKFKIKKSLRDVKFLTDYREMFGDKSLGGIVIATPASTHFKIAREILRAGFDVLIEKPLTTKVKDAKELCDIAEKQERVLMTGEIFRFNPALKWIKEKTNPREIRYIEARRVGLGPIRQDVGVSEDLGAHDVYISNWFMDSLPEKVNCVGISHNGKVEDIASLNLFYFEGITKSMTTIYVNWMHPTKKRGITIGCETRAFEFDDTEAADKVRISEKGVSYQPAEGGIGDFIASTRDGDILIPKIDLPQPLEEEVKAFVGCVRDRDYKYNRFGLETVRVLEAARESMKNDGAAVKLS